ncbi:EBP domain-containing protein [Calycina marina]|uniref:EBP domain-containing protein n=1 Tax=Calycina marina TaxID=1763456 RepID=A0A9P7Z9F2_9HELO|nr:EBP domain-containing protein [Calycina marina]
MATTASMIGHPYLPKGAILSGGTFTANSWDVLSLIFAFGAGCTMLLGATLATARKANPRLEQSDQLLVLWFVLTGSIHCFFEGYFVSNHTVLASQSTFFAQLWKEYSLCDSRYLTSDPFLLVIESLTVTIWGPLSFLCAYLIITSSSYRHPIQALVSTGHYYGNLIYFGTSLLEDYASGKKYYRPEGMYFWGYFVGMNSIWLVIPGYCLWNSIRETSKAFSGAKLEEDGGANKIA